MRENQENMVKITNLDLGESTMEHEDKTLSNYGRAKQNNEAMPQSISQQMQEAQKTESSNSLERDSNSNAEAMFANDAEDPCRKQADVAAVFDGDERQACQEPEQMCTSAQKEGPRECSEGQDAQKPPYTHLAIINETINTSMNGQPTAQHRTDNPFAQRESFFANQTNQDKSDQLNEPKNLNVKRINSATFDSGQKNKHMFNSGVKNGYEGRPSRGGGGMNNECTSSSLGKRNFGSYQKVQREQKEQRRIQRMDKEKQDSSAAMMSSHDNEMLHIQ